MHLQYGIKVNHVFLLRNFNEAHSKQDFSRQ